MILGVYRGFEIKEINEKGTVAVKPKDGKWVEFTYNDLVMPMSMIRSFIDHMCDDESEIGEVYKLEFVFEQMDMKELKERTERLKRPEVIREWRELLGLDEA